MLFDIIAKINTVEDIVCAYRKQVTESTLVAFSVKKQYESKRYGKVTIITRSRFE